MHGLRCEGAFAMAGEKAPRSLRGPPHLSPQLFGPSVPSPNTPPVRTPSPSPRLPQGPTENAGSLSPTGQRTAACAQPHLPPPAKLRPAPPRPPAPAMAPPEACPRLPHSRPALPVGGTPERSGFRLPPSCPGAHPLCRNKTSPRYMVKSNSHLNCAWLSDSPRKN
ncbi:small integral membrane protein 15 isoform X1 [Peromyscus maniculatus bairdii]|uniref:small integral membrane protein 15 isoform X1 n=1 Tax=Peromyscus maniculatus bairdii TaxID=230844 RepID=UPI001C2E8A3E|nr:small integral membrane protein 15 isoform X1 [Peromyscus maniculatus bairdii]